MSRETQYIGLTKAAQDFVAQCERLPSDTLTYGMFEEKLPLKRWLPHPYLGVDDRPHACIREIVQMVPWSSGPMIFTCLEIDWGNRAKSECFQWVIDPTVTGEVDYEKGAMWV